MSSDFEWDSDKNAANTKKHGIGFEEAAEVFEGPVFKRFDDRLRTGEIREISFGFLGSTVILAVAHTDRNGKTRIISARKATKSERRVFYAYLEKTIG